MVGQQENDIVHVKQKKIGSKDVHYSSGVANHFFHLLSQGTSDSQAYVCSTASGTTVSGIGDMIGFSCHLLEQRNRGTVTLANRDPAAQPIIGGKAPAAPPITIFCHQDTPVKSPMIGILPTGISGLSSD